LWAYGQLFVATNGIHKIGSLSGFITSTARQSSCRTRQKSWEQRRREVRIWGKMAARQRNRLCGGGPMTLEMNGWWRPLRLRRHVALSFVRRAHLRVVTQRCPLRHTANAIRQGTCPPSRERRGKRNWHLHNLTETLFHLAQPCSVRGIGARVRAACLRRLS
jgi:hypothetical protein